MKKIIRTMEKDIDKICVDPPKPKKNTKCYLCKKEIKKEFYWNGHFWHEKCKRKDSDKRIKKYLKRI